ncbi:MAG: hypothetical protein K9I85_04665, partial [Saprospiraceae bacterium]|nr:hypothetical protein [Saprospiraceae bacterium]
FVASKVDPAHHPLDDARDEKMRGILSKVLVAKMGLLILIDLTFITSPGLAVVYIMAQPFLFLFIHSRQSRSSSPG